MLPLESNQATAARSRSPARLRRCSAVQALPIVDATKEQGQRRPVQREECFEPWIIAKWRPFEWRADNLDHAGAGRVVNVVTGRHGPSHEFRAGRVGDLGAGLSIIVGAHVVKLFCRPVPPGYRLRAGNTFSINARATTRTIAVPAPGRSLYYVQGPGHS